MVGEYMGKDCMMNNYRNGNYGYTDNQTWNNSLWAVDTMDNGENGNYPVPPIAPEPNLPVWPGPGEEGEPMPPIEPGPDTNPPVWPGPGDENVPVPPIEPGPDTNPPVWPGPGDEGYPVPPIAPGPEPNPPAWPGPDENPPVWPGPGDEGYPVPPIAPGPEPNPPMMPGPSYAQVRFLNAAVNEGPFTITIAPRVIAGGLSFGNMTGYNRIADGYRTVTISNSKAPRTVLFRQSIPFVAGSKVTMAIINVSNGIDVIAVPDVTCSNNNRNTGCFRVANLSYQSAPLDVLLNDGKVIFRDVTYKEVTNFKQARPGEYEFFVVNTPNYPVPLNNDMDIMANPAYYGGILVPITSFRVQMRRDRMYTAYIIGNDGFVPSLQVLVVENR